MSLQLLKDAVEASGEVVHLTVKKPVEVPDRDHFDLVDDIDLNKSAVLQVRKWSCIAVGIHEGWHQTTTSVYDLSSIELVMISFDIIRFVLKWEFSCFFGFCLRWSSASRLRNW